MSENLSGTISTVTRGSKTVLFFSNDHNDEIQKYHLSGKFYETEELEIMAPYVRPYSYILEVGANIGNHTVYFDRILNARKIVVVEPNPDAIRLLRINLLLSACRSVDTRFLGIGLGAQDARANVQPSIWQNNLGGAELLPDPNGSVPILRGDSIFLDEPLDFIKIDVEGMEVEVLQGLKQTIDRHRPPMFVEIRDGLRPDFDVFLDSVGYEIKLSHGRYQNVTNYLVLPLR